MTASSKITNRQWTVAQHPVQNLAHKHFGYNEVEIGAPGPDQILLKTLYLNVAPVMRTYMMKDGGGRSPESSLDIGDVIHGRGVAEVVESNHPDYKVGDFVHGQIGWQTYKISDATPQEQIVRMKRRGIPAYYGLSALGMTGYSAYCGFVLRGEPTAGDAVLISGAAGGVGSLVIQIAKALNCGPVIGIAGGPEKCDLVRSLGADDMIDYRNENVGDKISALFPNGVNIYFDNVGGEILDSALCNLAYGARVVLCGSISEYTRKTAFGPPNYTRLRKAEADMRGFFVYNHQHNYNRAEEEIAAWIKEGAVRPLVDMTDGFEYMPHALIGLYSGANMGKKIVRVISGEDAEY